MTTQGAAVVAHHKPRQLARLVERLLDCFDVVAIHLDADADDAPFVAALGPLADKVRWAPRMHPAWGSTDAVVAELRCARTALDAGAERVTLMSGQDYLIKPPAVVRERLDALGDKLAMSLIALPHPDHTRGTLAMFERRYYWIGPRLLGFPNRFIPFPPKRRLPPGLKPFKASAWWSMPRDAIEHLERAVDEHPEWLRAFHRSIVPDELLLPSIVGSCHLAERAVDDLVEIEFEGWHPTTVTEADFPRLARSDRLLARKFDLDQNPGVLDAVDRQLLGIAQPAGSGAARPS